MNYLQKVTAFTLVVVLMNCNLYGMEKQSALSDTVPAIIVIDGKISEKFSWLSSALGNIFNKKVASLRDLDGKIKHIFHIPVSNESAAGSYDKMYNLTNFFNQIYDQGIEAGISQVTQAAQEETIRVDTMPNLVVYFHKDMLTDLSLGIERKDDGFLCSTNNTKFEEDNNGQYYTQMQMMENPHRQCDVSPLVLKIAVESYCNGFNAALKIYHQSSLLPVVLGTGFGAGVVGLTWYLKSKNYF